MRGDLTETFWDLKKIFLLKMEIFTVKEDLKRK